MGSLTRRTMPTTWPLRLITRSQRTHNAVADPGRFALTALAVTVLGAAVGVVLAYLTLINTTDTGT